jgi:hypothetical protein
MLIHPTVERLRSLGSSIGFKGSLLTGMDVGKLTIVRMRRHLRAPLTYAPNRADRAKAPVTAPRWRVSGVSDFIASRILNIGAASCAWRLDHS